MWFLLRSYQFCLSPWSPSSFEHLLEQWSRALRIMENTLSLRHDSSYWGKLSVQMNTCSLFFVTAAQSDLTKCSCMRGVGWGRSGRIWRWDSCNGISLWHTNTQCLLHGWQSGPDIFTAGLVSFGVHRSFKAFFATSAGKKKNVHAKTGKKISIWNQWSILAKIYTLRNNLPLVWGELYLQLIQPSCFLRVALKGTTLSMLLPLVKQTLTAYTEGHIIWDLGHYLEGHI